MGNIFHLDCSGLVCPLPVAKTKKKILEMKVGDILEITGDFAEAGENIKRYIDKIKEKIIDFKIKGENYLIKIEKQ
ncbi:MAG: sulfurtransferase TusA family protein [Promethearchaeota archaeon]